MASDRFLGFDTMDSYTADDVVFWHYIPDWNGTWCRFPPFLPLRIALTVFRLYGIDGMFLRRLLGR
jgi:hypothetical protein